MRIDDGWDFTCTVMLLWTTVRRWTPRKEAYYRGLRGQMFDIEVEEKND